MLVRAHNTTNTVFLAKRVEKTEKLDRVSSRRFSAGNLDHDRNTLRERRFWSTCPLEESHRDLQARQPRT
jgi:hypothetical protein